MLIKCKFCKKDLVVERLSQKYHPECTIHARHKFQIATGECYMCHVVITRTGRRSRYCEECAKKRAQIQRKEWSENHK